MMKPRILVVAEDAALRAALARSLMAAGYAVELAETPKRAREIIANAGIAVAIVAPNRLGPAGLELARELGGQVEHVIVIEGQSDDAGSPTGPPIPSGDYISMPASEQDVLARVRAALGAAPIGHERADPQLLRFEGLVLDTGGRNCVVATGQEVTLTRGEFSLLLAFGQQPGLVLSRDELSHAVAGRGAEPDDRSVDVLISRLRRKIEPDPKTPRIIVTVPGEGYKFTAKPQAALTSAPTKLTPPSAVPIAGAKDSTAEDKPTTARQTTTQEAAIQDARAVASFPVRRRLIGAFRTVGGATAAAALVSLAGLLIAFWYPGFATRGVPGSAGPAQKFDSAVMPFVYDVVRDQLSNYEREPGAKAIAISREGWGVSSGAADDEVAKNEAIERCRERDKGGYCRLYAVGNAVVWSDSTLKLPLPADVRADGSGMPPLTADGLEKLWQAVWHVSVPQAATAYVPAQDHKAIAVGLTSTQWALARPSRAEAIRIAIERCSDRARTPCLLLSVDGVLTVALPQTHRIIGPFTLAGEPEMAEAERQRIAQVYARKEWRALARGKSGRWYAVDGRETEGTAVDEALKSCCEAEPECVLHAIGNWRVGEKLESDRR